MSFFRRRSIGTGISDVVIRKVEVNTTKNGFETLKLFVENNEGAVKIFNILTSDTNKIDTLLKLTYNDVNDENINQIDFEINEQDFVGLKMKINVGLKNGYLNILEIMEWQEESCFEEENVIEDNCQEEF
ncbi:hypothetical protein ACV3U7_08390 [Clostridium perfringens]|uniref:hypothetical protein n=1 Tax=Clostridium perfringens TaxID=1502 RepID=UPI0018E42694|nr:hypothetical protein [Clostridium perfringens]MBI6042530.1 hypothetical protein [Clostridium perfringens]